MPETLAEIQRYTKLFWLNTGPYNNLTARKFVLKCTPAGVRGGGARGREIRRAVSRPQPAKRSTRMLARCSRCSSIRRSIRIVTNKTPGPGEDILTSSANNLYVGVSMKDLEGFKERYPLNSRVVKRGRPHRRGGLSRRRPLRQGRSARSSVTSKRRFRSRPQTMATALRALDSVLPDRGGQKTASRTTSRGCRTRRRRWTPSTASSRSTWTRAA